MMYVCRSLSGWLRNCKAAKTRQAAEAEAALPAAAPPAEATPIPAQSAPNSVRRASATAHVTLTRSGKVDCSKTTGVFGTGNIRCAP